MTKLPDQPEWLVVDCETTGLNPPEAELVELAACNEQYRYQELFGAARPIPPEISAIHHLTDDDIAGHEKFTSYTLDERLPATFNRNKVVLVAHNAAFDKAFVDPAKRYPWVCTYRLALHLLPDAPGHSNQTLRYYLGSHPQDVPENLHPHRALYDALTTWEVFKELMVLYHRTGYETKDLADFCQQPAILSGGIKFGKHRGKPWDQVPRDYLQWITRQNDGMDPDVKATARYYLEH